MKSYDLSIIIPVNDDYRILNCLDSIIKAKRNYAIEVIIICSFCSNKLMSKIKKYKEYFYLNILKKNSRNIGLLRNTGIKKSLSNLIYFVDSDCVLYEDSIVNAIKKSKNFLVTRGEIIFVGKRTLTSLDAKIRHKRYSKDKTFAYCPNLLVKKELFDKIGLYDETYTYGSDGELARRIRLKNIPVKYLKGLRLIHDGPKNFDVIKTWIRYGSGRYKRLKNARLSERIKGLVTPNLFDFKQGIVYNLAFMLCLISRWIGWTKQAIIECFNIG